MKHTLIIFLLISCVLSCKAQSPVVDIEADRTKVPNGAYFKDAQNKLGKYTGTWKYTNGNTTFTITIVKMLQYFNGKDYEDILIGEYKYVDNGVEIINTLSDINGTSIAPYDHLIVGSLLVNKKSYVACPDCSEGEMRAALSISDPSRVHLTQHMIVLRYIDSQQITSTIVSTHGVMIDEGDPINLRVPDGEYTMTKQ